MEQGVGTHSVGAQGNTGAHDLRLEQMVFAVAGGSVVLEQGSDKMAGLGDSGKMAGVEQHLSLV